MSHISTQNVRIFTMDCFVIFGHIILQMFPILETWCFCNQKSEKGVLCFCLKACFLVYVRDSIIWVGDQGKGSKCRSLTPDERNFTGLVTILYALLVLLGAMLVTRITFLYDFTIYLFTPLGHPTNSKTLP